MEWEQESKGLRVAPMGLENEFNYLSGESTLSTFNFSPVVETFHFSGVTKTRPAGPVGQFQTRLVKPLVPFLITPYLRAQQMLRLARNVYVFHAQSVYIARQALHLVILLNDVADAEDGPDDEQHQERNDLEDELIELFDDMKEWGEDPGNGELVDYEQRRLQIEQHYSCFFKERSYFRDMRNPSEDTAFQRSIAYDDRTILFRQWQNQHGPGAVGASVKYQARQTNTPSVNTHSMLPFIPLFPGNVLDSIPTPIGKTHLAGSKRDAPLLDFTFGYTSADPWKQGGLMPTNELLFPLHQVRQTSTPVVNTHSMPPFIPRIRPTKLKSLSTPITTTYLAGSRRHVPLLDSTSRPPPVDPYKWAQATELFSPLTFSNSCPSQAGSVSAAAPPLPPKIPPLIASADTFQRPREQLGSLPLKEQLQQSTGGWKSDGRTQIRASAARRRADDEILQHSFRAEADWRRRIALDVVLSSSFVAENEFEPVLGPVNANGEGVNTDTNVLSVDINMGVGSPGKSVYTQFLEQPEKSKWCCLFGDQEHPCPSQAVAFRRLERALDHVRSHLNHRPFRCKGECQRGESCDARFFALSHLQDHVKRTESAVCETCGQVIRIQNMPRHRLAH